MKKIRLFALLAAIPFVLYAQGPKPIVNDTVWVKGIPIVLVKIDAGTFQMGATSEQSVAASRDEKPVHSVTLGSYMIMQTEVTQELWQTIMDNNPSSLKGSNRPVHNVSWYDCMEFIEQLNVVSGRQFRLPTEAEWEYAARGAERSKKYKFSGSNNAEKVAWNAETVGGAELYYVQQKMPNELGIYDMSGNVWEWCSDIYGAYSDKAQTNPTGAEAGDNRVLRGGSWQTPRSKCRVSCRTNAIPYERREEYGLRLVLE